MRRRRFFALWIALMVAFPTMGWTAQSTVLFVLDGSGSMQAKLSGRRKIEVAQAVMGTLLKSLPAEVSLGLVTFGRNRKDDCQDIEMLVPIGTDRATFIKAVNTLDPKGNTPLTGAMQFAANQLREVESQTSVVVVSDGKESCGGDPCAVVRDAMAQGVRMQVHVVGFDVSEEEAEQLRCIAKAGNGKYFAAASAEQLGTALAQATKEVAPPPPPPPPPPKPKKILFEDQYERAELGQEYEILEPDPNRLALNEGKVVIVSTRPLKNLVLTNKTLPGDFVATVAVTMQVTYGNQPGLYYWIDENNYLFIGPFGQCCPSARRVPRFTKVISGQENSFEPHSNGLEVKSLGTRDIKEYATQPEVWYLQLERTGIKYTGRMSVDRTHWTDIGTHTVLQKGGRLGFGALSGGEIENAAEFDDFVVQGAE